MLKFSITSSIKNFVARIRAAPAKIAVAAKGGTELAAAVALQHTRDRFEPAGANPRAQTSPAGTRWPSPSPITMSKRRENDNANQAMVDTGLMVRSLQSKIKQVSNTYTARIFVDPTLNYSKPNGKTISVAKVARLLQAGFVGVSPGGPIIVPPRPFTPMDTNTINEINEGLVGRVVRAFRSI
jgi:hypothetical protein